MCKKIAMSYKEYYSSFLNPFGIKPRYRPYSTKTISRNVKRIKPGVIEIHRYADKVIRQALWILFFTFALVWICLFFDSNFHSDMQWVRNGDAKLAEHIQFWYHDKPLSEAELQSLQDYKWERIWSGLLECSVPFWFVLLGLIIPRFRPLRIDTHRRVVYFRRFGHWYITRYYEKGDPLRNIQPYVWLGGSLPSRTSYVEYKPLYVSLPSENSSKKPIHIDLGFFYPVCDMQYYDLCAFIADYMKSPNPDQEFAAYFQKGKRIWQDYLNVLSSLSLFPLGYNEKKTEAKIEQWLANNPEILNEEDFEEFR